MIHHVWAPLKRQGIAVRIAVCSDLHVCESYPSRQKLGMLFSAWRQLDPQPDAVVFAGDLTDFGTDAQYAALRSIVDENLANCRAQRVYCLGNHDTYAAGPARAAEIFTAQLHQPACQLVWVQGVPLVTLAPGPQTDDDYTGCFLFLRQSLREAAAKAPGSPIFVFAHHGIRDTAYCTPEWFGNYGEDTTRDLGALLRQYPQVIHISGHSHATLEDERSIDQSRGFTAIQDGTAGAYFENETGKCDPESGAPASVPPHAGEACQGLLVDVSVSGSVTVHRLNAAAGRFCGPAWHIDMPGILQAKTSGRALPFTYTAVRRGLPPVFPDGARAALRFLADGTAQVSFPCASPGCADGCSLVHDYRVRLLPEAGGEPICRWFFAEYYRSAPRPDWTVRISDSRLQQGDWTAEVSACTSFGQYSMPLISK